MGRPAGTRNPDFTSARLELILAARERLLQPDGARASFRELAAAAAVSVATMRHYFGSREGLIAAVLEQSHKEGLRYLVQVAADPGVPVRESLSWLLKQLELGFQWGRLSALHALGLAVGLREPQLGPAYLNELLEPTLQAVEARLARHVAQGELRPCDLRVAALTLVGPVVLALLHQGELGGTRCRPLAIDAFLEAHLEGFLSGYTARPAEALEEVRQGSSPGSRSDGLRTAADDGSRGPESPGKAPDSSQTPD